MMGQNGEGHTQHAGLTIQYRFYLLYIQRKFWWHYYFNNEDNDRTGDLVSLAKYVNL
jgi:hypothetical protein